MSINLGNNKIKKLYKGDDLITQLYKGDELIHVDLEAMYGFKFTIDTTLDEYGQHTSTRKRFTLGSRVSGQDWVSGESYFRVYWGDGETSVVKGRQGMQGVTHTYAEHGTYQILIMPHESLFTGIYPKKGWMTGITFGNAQSGYATDDACKVISIDTPFPQDSIVLFGTAGGDIQSTRMNLRRLFYGLTSLASAPDDLFDYIKIVHKPGTQTQSYEELFYETLAATGNYPKYDLMPQIKRLSARIDYSNASNYKNAFVIYTVSTFLYIAKPTFKVDYNGLLDNVCTTGLTDFSYMFSGWVVGSSGMEPLDADFFSNIDTSSGTNFSRMFYNCAFFANKPITEGILDFLDTHNGTDFSYMFAGAFSGCGPGGTTIGGTIPANLFSHIDTSNGVNFEGMFSGTFSGTRYKTCPAGLFSNIDTHNCTNFTSMFSSTFGSSYMHQFPSKLFAGIDTSNGTNFTRMFSGLFSGVSGYASPIADRVLPSDVFDGIDTSNAVNVSYMFASLFTGAAHIPPDNLFDPFDFSNAVDCSHLFDNMFYYGSGHTTVDLRKEMWGGCLSFPSAKNVSYMFYRMMWMNQFRWTDPAFFSSLYIPQAENFESMFDTLFAHQGGTTWRYTKFNAPLASNFFGDINMSHATNTKKMFASTFSTVNGSSGTTKVVVPSDLLDFVDLTNVTNAESMFSGTFSSLYFDYPTGLLSHAAPSAGCNTKNMFASTFAASAYAKDCVLNDVFDGMTDFSWATAANAATVMPSMFSQSLTTDLTVGSASTILQHFNFIPDADTNMFSGRTNLTDYATIDANWK